MILINLYIKIKSFNKISMKTLVFFSVSMLWLSLVAYIILIMKAWNRLRAQSQAFGIGTFICFLGIAIILTIIYNIYKNGDK